LRSIHRARRVSRAFDMAAKHALSNITNLILTKTPPHLVGTICKLSPNVLTLMAPPTLTNVALRDVIENLTNLQSLSLHECRAITDAALPLLARSTTLTSLDLRDCSITESGLRIISFGTMQLQSLRCSCSTASDSLFKQLATSFPMLTELESNSVYCTDATLTALSQCAQLRRLTMRYARFSNAAVCDLVEACNQLICLRVDNVAITGIYI